MVTGEKDWPVALIPATVTVSATMGPETEEPSPYMILRFPDLLLLVDEAEELYLFLLLQVLLVQFTDGTHRSADPAVR